MKRASSSYEMKYLHTPEKKVLSNTQNITRERVKIAVFPSAKILRIKTSKKY